MSWPPAGTPRTERKAGSRSSTGCSPTPKAAGPGISLRHVFCTTALSTWKLDVSDVSRLAGHSNTRVTFEMYVGSVAGALERACQATAWPGR